MTIEVTQEDIDKGRPISLCGCPVALAIGRVLKKTTTVAGRSFFPKGGKVHMLPKSAVNFIARFDAGKPVKPFRFKI